MMKTEILCPNTFKPVTIQIVLESEDDLMELWHRFNFLGQDGYCDDYESALKLLNRNGTMGFCEKLEHLREEFKIKVEI